MTHYVPEQGDVVWLSFDPQSGREQSGRRPAIVLTKSAYNRRSGLAVVCPLTKQVKNYAYESPIPPGCAVEGVVLCDHVKSVDWAARQASFIDEVPYRVVEDVLNKIHSLLGPQ